MAGYHLFFRTDEDRLEGVTVRICDSDEQAIEWAKQLLGARSYVEVWRGDAFVGAVDRAGQGACQGVCQGA